MSSRLASARKPVASDRTNIWLLQYGRGVAALLVCIFHFERGRERLHPQLASAVGSIDFNYIFRAGHSGVEFFFILSGFIIFHVHQRDLGRPGRLSTFYLNRAIRILPMYWLITISIGFAYLALSASSWFGLDKFLLDIFLIPREGIMLLPTAWTLQHEAVFYLLFGVVILNWYLGVTLFALWQAACLIVLVFNVLPQDYSLPATTLWGYYNFGFAFGIIIAFLYARVDFSRYRNGLVMLGGIGFVGLLVCFIGECRFGSESFFASPAASTLIYFSLYALVIVALLSIENEPRPFLDMTLGTLGAASYTLYLIHVPFASALDKFLQIPALRPLAGSTPIFLLSVAGVVAVSIVMHYLIERPTLRWLRRCLLDRSRSRPEPGLKDARSN